MPNSPSNPAIAVPVPWLQALNMFLYKEIFDGSFSSLTYQHELRMLEKEAAMLSELHNDRVLSFRGIVYDPVTSLPKYLIMELAKCNLRQYLQSLQRPLSLPELNSLCRDVVEGLVYLHANGIVHCDLKPDNVLVFFHRGSAVVKIADVGLARVMAATQSGQLMARVTHPGGVGTPLYAAAEVLDGVIDARSDMFSFGIMVAEIVVVFMAGKRSGTMRLQMLEDATAFLQEHSAAAFAALLERCCLPDDRARLSSIDALDALDTMALDGEADLVSGAGTTASDAAAATGSRRASVSLPVRHVFLLGACL